jgi:hypothetical protein
MAALGFELIIQRGLCPDGVELVGYDQAPPTGYVQSIDKEPWPLGQKYFRRRSQHVEPFERRLSDLEDPLVLRYLNAKDDSAVEKFFSRFGLTDDLSTRHKGVPEFAIDRGDVLAQKRSFGLLLRQACGEASSAHALDRHLFERSQELTGRLLRDPETKSLRVAFQAAYLSEFMVWEIVSAAVNGVRLATCEHCGVLFLTGPLTGRRSHAHYHADKCRVAAMRARNAHKNGGGHVRP